MADLDIDKLRADYEAAEEKALAIAAEKDEALDTFRGNLRTANDEAAAAQNDLCDTEVHLALKDRPDREAVAARMRSEAERQLSAFIVHRNSRPDGTLDVEAYDAEVQALRDRASSLGFDHLPFYSPAE